MSDSQPGPDLDPDGSPREASVEVRFRKLPRPDCPVCGRTGEPEYRDLIDVIWGAPERWSVSRCPDRTCDMRWLDPMPIAEDIALAYLNYSTHVAREAPAPSSARALFERIKRAWLAGVLGYPRKEPDRLADALSPLMAFLPQHRRRLAASVAHLRGDTRGKLLDVGSGSGDLVARMRALGWDAQGVDPDPRAVDVARRRGLPVALGTLADQNYPQDHFDAITLSHVIEHAHDPRAMIRECFRVLAPGGRISIETPNVGSWCHVLFGSQWRGLEPPRHLQLFTLAALDRMVRNTGFDIEHMVTSSKAATFFAAGSLRIATARPETIPTRDQWGPGTTAMAKAITVSEVVLQALVPDIGEELVMVARKPIVVYEAPVPVEPIAPVLAPETAA